MAASLTRAPMTQTLKDVVKNGVVEQQVEKTVKIFSKTELNGMKREDLKTLCRSLNLPVKR